MLGQALRNALDKIKSTFTDNEMEESIKDIQRALLQSDVDVELVFEISKKLKDLIKEEQPKGITRKEFFTKQAFELLADLLGGKPKEREPKKILLVGLFGSGKTTTSAKLAHFYQKRGKKVLLVAADTYRPAAYEQLKQLSEKIQVSFYGEPEETNPSKIVRNALKEKADIIIVDSAGRNALDSELQKEIKEIKKELNPDNTWLVLSGDIGKIAKPQAQAFHDLVDVNGVIITKLDGSGKGGGALAACRQTQAPVLFIGTGEHIDDLEIFDAERFLSRVMGYGDLQGLMEKISNIQDEIENPLESEFTLESYYKQLEQTKKMGSLGKIAEMIGLKQAIPQQQLDMTEEKMKHFKYIMDSMTKKERKNPEILSHSRIERIAKGSGTPTEEIRQLLKQYKLMKNAFEKMKDIQQEDLKEGSFEQIAKKLGMGKKKKKKRFW